MIRIRTLPWPFLNKVACLFALGAVLACSNDGEGDPAEIVEPASTWTLPDQIDIQDPAQPIVVLDVVEPFTEEVADRLLSFGAELAWRDFDKAYEYLSEDFAGHSLHGLAETESRTLHLDASERTFNAAMSPIQDRDDFIDGLEDLLGGYERIELVLWKVKGAEFESGKDRWGKVHLKISMIGSLVGGGREHWTAWADARVEKRGGNWLVTRIQLESCVVETLVLEPFDDVSGAVGVAHLGTRFGKPGNVDDAWNGIAGVDVNEDGRWDVFLPSSPRNFLYVMGGDGTFNEEAQERGLAQPSDGTGAVFFDFDLDGDQDLFVGQRAWPDEKGNWQGKPLDFYENVGKGQFEHASERFGLSDQFRMAFSVTVFDYDNDGWLDVFVCGYGRAASEINNDWIEANNGGKNSLFRNVGGKRFVDVAGDLGIAGSSWSYASAAADYDRDGDTDLYVANDYGTNRLWRNDGGKFVDVALELGVRDQGNGMGAAWGDLNCDGRLDLYVSNMSSTAGNRILNRLGNTIAPAVMAQLKKAAAGNTVFLASEAGKFTKQPKSAGGVAANWAWSVALSDLDLDGCLDVFCVNGFVTGDTLFDT